MDVAEMKTPLVTTTPQRLRAIRASIWYSYGKIAQRRKPPVTLAELIELRRNVAEAENVHKQVADFFEDTADYDKDPDRFLKIAKLRVVGANAVETAESGEYELTVDDLYIVWFAKILGNWKAMISTNQPGDGLYFEVTYNGEKNQTYVDIYKKSANHMFDHNHF